MMIGAQQCGETSDLKLSREQETRFLIFSTVGYHAAPHVGGGGAEHSEGTDIGQIEQRGILERFLRESLLARCMRVCHEKNLRRVLSWEVVEKVLKE